MKRSWLAADSGERNVEYELVSTVVHHGKAISSGHYTADVRQPDDRWAMRVGQGRNRCLPSLFFAEIGPFFPRWRGGDPGLLTLQAGPMFLQLAAV